VVDACLRLVTIYGRAYGAGEPVCRLSRYLGPSAGSFDPADYGDPYTKRTHLWVSSRCRRKSRTATEGSKMHRIGPGPERKNLRSQTPPGLQRNLPGQLLARSE